MQDCLKIFEKRFPNPKLSPGKSFNEPNSNVGKSVDFQRYFEKEKEYNDFLDLSSLMNHSKFFLNHSEGEIPDIVAGWGLGGGKNDELKLSSEYETWFRGQIQAGPRDLMMTLKGNIRPTIHG